VERLIIEEHVWARLRAHLLADSFEHLAFLLARPAGERLLVRDLILIEDVALDDAGDSYGLSLPLPALLDVMNTAVLSSFALIEAHSHPHSAAHVTFSSIDLRGQHEMVEYIADIMPGRPYAAMVLGQEAVAAQVWRPGGSTPTPMNVVVLGDSIGTMVPSRPETRRLAVAEERFGRQVLAIGRGGQEALSRTNVAVVGLGGIGSFLAEELARLGVGTLTLIDDDLVESTNLHRVLGSTAGSVGRSKVSIAAEMALASNPDIRTIPVFANVREPEAIDALRAADVVLGAVDTDAGRLILNEFCVAYMTPYVDCGVGIEAKDARIIEAGGRIVTWVPGRPCLHCCREINLSIAAEELETEGQRAFRRQHGYVAGAVVPEPAVMSLNGTVASMAVTEVLALCAGLRPTIHYSYYDFLAQRAGPRLIQSDPRCVVCANLGKGDEAGLQRYSRTAFDSPSDRQPRSA